MEDIRLTDEDPQIWGRCNDCCRTGRGIVVGKYYARAFTPSKWKKGPKCENCKQPLTEMYRVK